MRVLNLIDKKFDRLKVKKYIFSRKGKRYFECVCDCGEITVVSGANLIKKHTKSCGCIYKEKICSIGNLNSSFKGHQEISLTFFNSIKYYAVLRNLEFNISIEQIWDLFLKQNRKCALSGFDLRFQSRLNDHTATASLDRIDSSKGYNIDNIQWVHKYINLMKLDHTLEEFIKYCNAVSDYQRNKNVISK